MTHEGTHEGMRPGEPRTPGLPARGWLPDPSETGLERFWDGTRWTGRVRDRHTRMEFPPPELLTYSPRTWDRELPRPPRRRLAGLKALAFIAVVGAGAYYGYQWLHESEQLPTWAESSAVAAVLSVPAVPDTGYPTYGSTELVNYLEAGMVAQEGAIDVTYWANDVGIDGISDALLEAAAQNPYLYVKGWAASQWGARTVIEPEYVYAKEEADRRRATTLQAVTDALATSGALQASDPEERVTLIHDWIVDHATYDMTAFEEITGSELSDRVAQSQEAYAIFALGTAVCNGYAMAFAAMAEQAGVDAVVVTGSDGAGETGGAHAWNKVLIGDEWLLVDTTWNDPIAPEPILRHDYLLVEDGAAILDTRVTHDDWVVDANRHAFGA
ncbi:transglutaminase domain-containing protein [Demequina sp. NBRC 110053]|uniref:transglutaminase domain-containing protein n=1 Tax=Demequina sp. NBRC 110053 TaxID=1570342 RepID=UPI0009FCC7F1|nr:transglutaminase domain-containing protein [Demequina sp. NBRC 110053]